MIATKKIPAAIMSNPLMIFLLRVPLRCWRRGSYLGDRIQLTPSVVRIHQSLRVTPAMAAGVFDTLRSLADMVRVIEAWEGAGFAKISGTTVVG
jgi:hypothetical protein